MPVKCVLFDYDGTLLNSRAVILQTMNVVVKEMGLTMPSDPNDLLRGVGMAPRQAIEHTFPGHTDEEYSEMLNIYAAHHTKALHHPASFAPVFEGVVDLLGSLMQAKIPMAIVTSMGRQGLERSLAENNIGHYFSALKTPDEGQGKPAPDLLYMAMHATGAESEGTVMVGDTSFDIQAAHNASVGSVAVTWGNHPRALLEQAKPTHIVETMPHLKKVLLER